MKNLNITTAQFDICWEDKKANFEKIEELVFSKMNASGSDFLVLPEMFATGFTMKPASYWEDLEGPTVKWLKKWAKQLNTCIGGGIITKTEQNDFQNTFIVVFPNGDIEVYQKRHLFRMGEENEHYVQGKTQRIIEINGWKINLQVCYDLRFPVFSRNKIKDDQPYYDAIVYIANWPEARTYAWTNLLQARAIENQAFVIGVNRVGSDGANIAHSGESAIIDPLGKHILKPIKFSESIETVSLDYIVLQNARAVFPVLLDADDFTITDN